jgi:MFS family permease
MKRNFALLNNLGALVEYYDYVLFALCLTYLQGAFFSPNSFFGVFLAFQVGAWSRLIFGHIFSLYLRSYSLPAAMTVGALVMGCATLAIAFLPSYGVLGIFASFALIALRFVQGAAFALEVPNTLTFGAQNVPLASQGLFTSFTISSVTLGSIIANVAVLFCSLHFSEEIFSSIGWRLLFGIGGLCGIGVYLVRRQFTGGIDYSDLERDGKIVADSFLKSLFGPLTSKDLVAFIKRTLLFLPAAYMITNAMCFPALFARLYGASTSAGCYAGLCGLIIAAICAPIFGLLLSSRGGKLNNKEILAFHSLLGAILWLGLFCLQRSWLCTFCMLYQLVLTGVLIVSYSTALRGLKRDGATLSYNLAFALSASALPYFFSRLTFQSLATVASSLILLSAVLVVSSASSK